VLKPAGGEASRITWYWSGQIVSHVTNLLCSTLLHMNWP